MKSIVEKILRTHSIFQNTLVAFDHFDQVTDQVFVFYLDGEWNRELRIVLEEELREATGNQKLLVATKS